MTLIRIRELAATADGFNAVVSYNHGEETTVLIKNAFSEEEEERLERLVWVAYRIALVLICL